MTDDAIPLMTDDEVREFIRTSRWIFAKSMPNVPHEYTLRKEVASDAEFVRFVQHIRGVGEVRPWGKYRNSYLDIDGMSYWTMGSPIEETILINREVTGVNDKIGASLRRPR